MESEKALPVALVVSFKFLRHPNDLVAIVLVLMPIGLIILSGALFGVWARAAILAKIYRRAAEDGRDVAQELGFMSRDE